MEPMSKRHSKYDKVKLYPATSKAVRDRQNRDAVAPSFTKLVNVAVIKGIKLV